MRRARATVVMALAALLGACATVNEAPVEDRSTSLAAARGAATGADEHVVVAGDTLYGVAFRHDLDYRRLAAWNGIASPYTIRPGQRLRLTPPPAPPGAPAGAGVASAPQPAFDGTTQTYAAGDAAVSSAAPLQVEPLDPAPAPAAPPSAPPPAKPTPATGPVSAAIGASAAAAPPARTPPPPAPTPAPTTTAPPPTPSAATAPTPAAAAPPLAIAKAPTQTVGGVAWRWPTAGRVAVREARASRGPGFRGHRCERRRRAPRAHAFATGTHAGPGDDRAATTTFRGARTDAGGRRATAGNRQGTDPDRRRRRLALAH